MAASSLDGTKVITADGEHVGKISDIMLDVRSGRIAYAVLSEGGFLGFGTTLHAIPWGALTLNVHEKVLLVSLMADEIKNALQVRSFAVLYSAVRHLSLSLDSKTGSRKCVATNPLANEGDRPILHCG